MAVYVLLGDQNANSARFFVVRNDELTGVLHLNRPGFAGGSNS